MLEFLRNFYPQNGAKRFCPFVVALAFGIVVVNISIADDYDDDLHSPDRHRIPGALEGITGMIHRHSKRFYEWQVGNRKSRLNVTPADPKLVEELALAYARIGKSELGIEILQKALAVAPKRFESNLVLADIYFLNERFDSCLSHLQAAAKDKSTELGKLLVVEYLMETGSNGMKCKLPLRAKSPKFRQFSDYVKANMSRAPNTWFGKDAYRLAIEGVLHFIKLWPGDSAALLEMLGDIFANSDRDSSGRYVSSDSQSLVLAARAYLKAEKVSAVFRYRGMAKELFNWSGATGRMSAEEVRLQFDLELAEAQAWNAKVSERETQLLATSVNPEVDFAREFPGEPKITTKEDASLSMPVPVPSIWSDSSVVLIVTLLIVAPVACLATSWLIRRRRCNTPSARSVSSTTEKHAGI